ncbi:MAG: chorismate synthase [Spirochaetales bacterium]|nr:chorismate synthase [Spirochaetales bacterium]
MAGNTFGKLFKITTFGESHGAGVGVIIDGVPPGLELTETEVQSELDRRKPGQSDVTTPRKESDEVHFFSGIFEGKTTGTPLMMLLHNSDADPSAYDSIKDLFRPGHADFTFLKKYGLRDHRGSGRASGRETAGRVAAGAVAKKLLKLRGIEITAYTLRAAGVSCKTINFNEIEKNPMRAADPVAAKEMEKRVKKLIDEGNSTGGIIECRITGVPAGLGEPVFDKLDALLGHAILSLGAVKGIEFGAGFACADMSGIEHNDWMDEDGFQTNNAGGILGGISTGEEILFRAAVKPTSSIEAPQETLGVNGKPAEIITRGRHDPCICPRIIPVIESMAALVLEDLFKEQSSLND